MQSEKDPAENSIVDFIDDDSYYQYRKDKKEVENASWAIYIFAAISCCFYIIYALIHQANFNWIVFAINIILIIIYFCLGSFSYYKPFTAFIILFSILGIILLLEIITSQMNFRGIIVKAILVVYLSMRLDKAGRVQAYESKHP